MWFIQSLVRFDPSYCKRVVEFFFRVVDFFFFFFVFALKRTNNDRLSVPRERNVLNLAYQRYQGQQLQRSGMENPEDGLADWFVIKHTRDTTLSRDLLSKYGFVDADATQVGINTKNKGKGKGAEWKWGEKCAVFMWDLTVLSSHVITRGSSMVFPSYGLNSGIY